MAGHGPAPKGTRQRARDQARRDATTVVVAPDGAQRGPDLPMLPEGWPTQTEQWWSTWRRSPLAQRMSDTDWDFLLDTALLHAALWRGSTKVAGELRLRVAKFGATPEDRARLRLQVEPPAGATPTPVKPPSRYEHLRTGSASTSPARPAKKTAAKKTPTKAAAKKKSPPKSAAKKGARPARKPAAAKPAVKKTSTRRRPS